MKNQKGLTLLDVIITSIVIVQLVILGFKVAPTVIEYYQLKKVIALTAEKSTENATLVDIKTTFGKLANVEQLHFNPEELVISKNAGRVVIAFSYQKKIPLAGNLSLLLDYSASTK